MFDFIETSNDYTESDHLNILQKQLFNILKLLINQLVFMFCMWKKCLIYK